MKKKSGKIKFNDLVILTIVLILTVIALSFFAKEVLSPKIQDETAGAKKFTVVKEKEKEQIQVAKTEEEIIKKLSTQGEWDRMDYYCGVYFKYISEQKYEQAYELLYPEFKENFFPTLEKYKEYVNKTYPKDFSWVDDDITRQGNIYVLKVKVLDTKGSKENEKSQRIVIKENTYNKFVISFQVI